MDSFLDILFPKTCSICGRKGNYLCDSCKKLFKRTLPECYVCRRISQNFKTHDNCLKKNSLNATFVGWEYNSLSSDLLKKYKYKGVYDIAPVLSKFLVETLEKSTFLEVLRDTLIVNVPISYTRLNDRGFNQTYEVSKCISERFNLPFCSDLIWRRNTHEHQALKDRSERGDIDEESFYVKDYNISPFKSMTIVDDVITTGATLNTVSSVLRKRYGDDLVINGIAMFRGRAYYSSEGKSIFGSSSTV